MVETITAANVDGIRLTPKLSPIKYMKGSKKASRKKLLISERFKGFNRPSESVRMNRKMLEIINLITTSVNGL